MRHASSQQIEGFSRTSGHARDKQPDPTVNRDSGLAVRCK
jgi:hypothetical protein